MKHAAIALLPVLALLAGCGSSHDASEKNDVKTVASELPRDTSPSVPAADADALRDGNTAFAVDMYRSIASSPSFAKQNVFYSPYSISSALAMTYAGARGNTATEMAKALHFTLPNERLHPAFDSLDLALASRAKGGEQGDDDKGFRLRVSNSIWGTPRMTFEKPFLDTLAVSYGAGMRLTDFAANPEAARAAINGWVDKETEDRIQELLPSGTIDSSTRLVLVNAIYFNAAWADHFDPNATKPGTFHAPGGDVQAPMMNKHSEIRYGAGDGYRAVSLPYQGGLSFVAVVPEDVSKLESSLDGKGLAAIEASLSPTDVILSMPKFEIKGSTFSVRDQLTALGMPDAFSCGAADFSGMTKTESLCISDVLHQAFVKLDEAGTEAAAATAVVMVGSAAPVDPPKPVELTIDKPFVFYLKDDRTGAVLFMGRIENP